jgi:hypothetical protein
MNETWEGDEFEREVEDEFLDHRTGLLIYTEATQHKIIGWQPEDWWLPDEKDLMAVQEFLFGWPQQEEWDEYTGNVVDKLYFSAAAVAIRFLKRFTPSTRSQLRMVVLEEDHPSIAEPYTHMQGLAPLLQENRRLRIQQRVNVWQAILVPNSFKGRIVDALRQITYWIQQANLIHQRNIIPSSYSLILHGPSSYKSQNLSDTVIQAAKWQDANAEFFKQTGEALIEHQQLFMEGFSEMIKEMIQGHIPARFESQYDTELWDPATILRQHEGEWPRDKDDAIAGDAFKKPDGGWVAARREYWLDLDPFGRLAWWNELVEKLQ